MSSPQNSSLFLCFILISLLSPVTSLSCTNQKFTNNQAYPMCLDIMALNSSLHWHLNSSNSSLSIVFIAAPSKAGGWISWAINPTGSGMVGAQALIAFNNDGQMTVKTYNVTSHASIIPGKLSFDVWVMRAEESHGLMMIFATVKILKNTETLNHVWQVGPSVTAGRPEMHEFGPANRASEGTLNLNGASSFDGEVDSRTRELLVTETASMPAAAGPDNPTTPPPAGGADPNQDAGGIKLGQPLALALLIAVPFFITLFCLGCYFRRRNARKSPKDILRENFGDECSTLESLQFDLGTIEAATNKFSSENRIGKGGFGEVYKGIFLDGREIAMKRLSRSSTQGAIEFKNEILMIAKLQHRNLVALLGFCVEGQEKILIYEFVPNKSLDYFLFDSQNHRLLSWNERYKIIGGIAQGILYLHEYSRLKVIHRDLKPSNILLDNDMNPKISDFGMAKMIALDQDRGSTMRIVGTYGYMSPEYAMFGQFSEKSDVYSFGVMILEIVSGKRNSSSYESDEVVGLLNYAWRRWKDQTPLDVLDPNIKESHSELEVTRCIQIGLLCIQEHRDNKPIMSMVHTYLNNISIELPSPREPTFYIQGRMEPDMVAVDLGQSTNNAILSVNEISIPR